MVSKSITVASLLIEKVGIAISKLNLSISLFPNNACFQEKKSRGFIRSNSAGTKLSSLPTFRAFSFSHTIR